MSLQHQWRLSAAAGCDAMLRLECRPSRKGKSDSALARSASMLCALLSTSATLAFFFAADPEDTSSNGASAVRKDDAVVVRLIGVATESTPRVPNIPEPLPPHKASRARTRLRTEANATLVDPLAIVAGVVPAQGSEAGQGRCASSQLKPRRPDEPTASREPNTVEQDAAFDEVRCLFGMSHHSS